MNVNLLYSGHLLGNLEQKITDDLDKFTRQVEKMDLKVSLIAEEQMPGKIIDVINSHLRLLNKFIYRCNIYSDSLSLINGNLAIRHSVPLRLQKIISEFDRKVKLFQESLQEYFREIQNTDLSPYSSFPDIVDFASDLRLASISENS